ncbi:hypothetical protein RHOFW104T7_07425 [Rhodanobacter thiooxydans]|uniref:Thioredoxin n=1 Tax=Rhodanobacter thiooxydans TaxID=416169 RepID=A0A154QKG1_9GAMM|nr:hypothetical protein [Rhodanobacter thiooxydans]KZC24640.1 hypothetical protein RHOFW104T7_07425 [Rhodanobacter thiooxydans]MCW0202760.1 hypothetical protein [Rhodanobacter thiooxydans]
MPCTTIARLLWLLCLLALPLTAPAQDAGVTRNAALAIPATPITSRAALDAYVRDTPPESSPLNWLTPGARRRFLDSLVYREHGLGGMSLADLRYELTREQAYTLLRLFGAQNYAIDLDALTTPPPAAEAPAASTLEPAYDRLLAAAGNADVAAQAQAIARGYAADFAPAQTNAQRHALDDRDAEFLFRAANLAFRTTGRSDYLADLRRDFVELQRRQRIDRPHLDDFHDALLVAHRDDEARTLLATHPGIQRSPPPSTRTFSRIRSGQPSLWVVTPDTRKRELVRFRFNVRAPAQVIVLASTGCHFSANAARDIEADPLLRDLFREYGQWVAPPDEVTAFDVVRDWNEAHPALRLGIAYDKASLPMVERVETPVFYFLDHGTVIDTVVGWPSGGNLDAIRRGLRRIDLLN